MLPQYMVGHLKQLLAEDPRTNLLDARVRVVGNRVFLAGCVESEERRQLVEDVVREVVPADFEIVNELGVESYAHETGGGR